MGGTIKEYKKLKTENKDILYIFLSGVFYICYDEDAHKINEIFNYKIVPVGVDHVKCGFPINSIEEKLKILDDKNIKYKVINEKIEFKNKMEYLKDIRELGILEEIEQLDLNNISPIKAFEKLQEFQNKIKNK